MGSSRLPGKVLQPFAGSSILDRVLLRLKAWSAQIIVATTTRSEDDAIVAHAEAHGVAVYRGSATDVLGRFLAATNAEWVLRVCADNPFLQTDMLNDWWGMTGEPHDYISFANAHSIPAIKTHWGLFPELIRRSALENAQQSLVNNPNAAFYREHVTNYLYTHPNRYGLHLLPAPSAIRSRTDLRFTVDDATDFTLMETICKLVSPEASLDELIHVVDAHPEIRDRMIAQIQRYTK